MSDKRADSVAFVRETFLAEQPAPASATGVVRWLQDNLFPTWANGLLTIVSLYVIYLLVSSAAPWMFNGLWNTQSLSECREVLDGATGACFSVLTERWNQLLFGFKYPPDQYWRPTLAFVLMFAALAPVLFFDLPRKLLIITALFPFTAYWLIWGGTIFTPLVALLGVVAGYLVYARFVKGSFATGALGGVAAAIAVWMIGGALIPDGANDTAMLSAVPSRDLGGFMLNMMLGLTVCRSRFRSGLRWRWGVSRACRSSRWICVVFIEFIRGVPLITLLFVANVVLAYFFPPGSNLDLILRVIIMITMFSARPISPR
jgi:general L-amino acid transport system permease protein